MKKRQSKEDSRKKRATRRKKQTKGKQFAPFKDEPEEAESALVLAIINKI